MMLSIQEAVVGGTDGGPRPDWVLTCFGDPRRERALQALAAIGQSNQPDGDDASQTLWGYLHGDLRGTAAPAAGSQVESVVPLKRNRGSAGRQQTP